MRSAAVTLSRRVLHMATCVTVIGALSVTGLSVRKASAQTDVNKPLVGVAAGLVSLHYMLIATTRYASEFAKPRPVEWEPKYPFSSFSRQFRQYEAILGVESRPLIDAVDKARALNSTLADIALSVRGWDIAWPEVLKAIALIDEIDKLIVEARPGLEVEGSGDLEEKKRRFDQNEQTLARLRTTLSSVAPVLAKVEPILIRISAIVKAP